MPGEPMALKFIDKINGKLKCRYMKKNVHQNFVQCFAMRLFSHILITRAQLGTRILSKNQKRKNKLSKISAYCFALD